MKKRLFTGLPLIVALTLAVSLAALLTMQCAGNPAGAYEPGIKPRLSSEEIAKFSSWDFVHLMGAGWNLGNTLDAHWNAKAWGTITKPHEQETLWGNPVTTKAMIDRVKASGFDTVRIPVTWYIFTGPGPEYQIDKVWMDRVQEIVDYVIDNGMFCILNIHHDDYHFGPNWECGWLTLYRHNKTESRPLNDEEKQEMHLRLKCLWEQIADRFKDYDEYLIFEGLNEPRTLNLDNITAQMWVEQSNFLNELLQTFINTVRASGGKNPDRHLMVTPYFASVGMNAGDREGRIRLFVDKENKKMRVDDPRDRLIASLHYYEPWGFAAAPSSSEWFSATFDLSKGNVNGNINNVIRIINENFIQLGIPVIMGETGAVRRDEIAGHNDERVKWAENYVGRLKELGVPTVIWDDGGSFKLLERSMAAWMYPKLARALVEAAKTPIKAQTVKEQ